MDILFLLTGVLFIIWGLRNTIYLVYLWQIREYRPDRLLIHLKETVQGRSLFLSPLSLLKWVAIGLYIFVIFREEYLHYFHLFVTGIFALQVILIIKEFLFHQFRKPEFTPKAVSLIVTTFLSILLLFSFPLMDKYFWLLFLDRLIPFVVAFFVFAHSFPTEIYRDLQINNAMRKIRIYPDLLVIGITGSYGKSSTKEYLAQLLSKKFSVITTKGNHHTLSGIAEVINKNLSKETQLLIVEMGTYGKGEIAHMSHVVKPNIGIITGINDQHLSLFGSLKESIDAKYELVESLPKKGLALFNGNDTEVRKLYRKTKKPKVLFGYESDSVAGSQSFAISAENITVRVSDISFSVVIKGRSLHLKAPLLGTQAIEHLLPAIFIAEYFGMTDSQIRKAVSGITALPNTMMKKLTKNGSLIIDDTVNSNPESLVAAIEYLTVYKKKKYLVFQPMIELGKNAHEHHYQIGKKIANICTAIFLTNNNYHKDIVRGILDARGFCAVMAGNSRSSVRYLHKNGKKGDVIIFEGQDARRIMEKLL